MNDGARHVVVEHLHHATVGWKRIRLHDLVALAGAEVHKVLTDGGRRADHGQRRFLRLAFRRCGKRIDNLKNGVTLLFRGGENVLRGDESSGLDVGDFVQRDIERDGTLEACLIVGRQVSDDPGYGTDEHRIKSLSNGGGPEYAADRRRCLVIKKTHVLRKRTASKRSMSNCTIGGAGLSCPAENCADGPGGRMAGDVVSVA